MFQCYFCVTSSVGDWVWIILFPSVCDRQPDPKISTAYVPSSRRDVCFPKLPRIESLMLTKTPKHKLLFWLEREKLHDFVMSVILEKRGDYLIFSCDCVQNFCGGASNKRNACPKNSFSVWSALNYQLIALLRHPQLRIQSTYRNANQPLFFRLRLH